MKMSGLLKPGSRTRLQHLEDAAGNDAERGALRTSYELTKGGKLLWTPKDRSAIPTLGKNGRDAIRRGMHSYYADMIGLNPDSLGHLEEVNKYISMEMGSREDRLRVLAGTPGMSEKLLPSDPRLRGVVKEHLSAELDALREINTTLSSRIAVIEKANKKP